MFVTLISKIDIEISRQKSYADWKTTFRIRCYSTLQNKRFHTPRVWVKLKKIISAKIHSSVIQNEDSRIKYFQLIARMALNRGKDYQVRRFQKIHLNKNSKPRTKFGKTFVLNRNTYRQLVASLYKHPKWLHYVRTLKLFLTLISYRLNVWVYTYSSVFRYPTLYWRYI